MTRRLTRSALLLALALTGVGQAAAQTPLCAWNGAGLTCPSTPAPAISLAPGVGVDRFDPQLRIEQDRQRSFAESQAQADLAAAVAADRLRQAEATAARRADAEALVAADRCPEAEIRARNAGDPALLAQLQTNCAGRH